MPRTSTENTNELSEFEKQRLANIAERDALLKKLTLEAQSAGLFAKKAHKNNGANGIDKSKSKKNLQPKIKKENEPPIPRRMSSRLRGLTAESDVAKRKADEEYDAAQEAARAKRVRKSDTFTLDGMFVSGQKLTADALIGIDVITKGASKPYERTFGEEDVKKTTDKDLKALRENLSSLELWEAWEPNRMLQCHSFTGFHISLLTFTRRAQNDTRACIRNDISSFGIKAVDICRGQNGPPRCLRCFSGTTRSHNRGR
jgi:WD repeat-containing protein 76